MHDHPKDKHGRDMPINISFLMSCVTAHANVYAYMPVSLNFSDK